MSPACAVTWTDRRPFRRFAALAFTLALVFASLGATLHAAGSPSIAVIVRSTSAAVAQAERTVVEAGGRIDLPLAIINGFRAIVPAGAVGRLALSPAIWAITPDAPVHMNSVDTTLGYDTGDDGSPYLVAKAIGATDAWTAGYTGTGIDVAVIDTGVAPLPELAGRLVNGPDLSPESQVDALRYLDSYGHGTNMAGLIAGRDPGLAPGQIPSSDNYTGVAPGARIVSVKVANYNGATDVSQVLAAMDWVVQHRNSGDLNIRVLNLSFGTDSTQDYRLDPLTYAAEVAWRAGIVVVVAGGNEGFGNARLNDPAYDPFVIAVGADDTRGTSGSGNDVVPDFSARGDSRGVDFVAPGRSVISLRVPGSYLDQTHPEGRVGERYFRGSGTSQAAAVASGAVALLLQQRPDLTPDQVKYILRQSVAPLPKETSVAKGQGLLSVSRALQFPTPTGTAYVQTWDPATGLGSLDGARGTQRISDSGDTLSGEQDIFGHAFTVSDWARLSALGSSWTGGDWMGSSWTGSSWTGSSWTGSSWTGSRGPAQAGRDRRGPVPRGRDRRGPAQAGRDRRGPVPRGPVPRGPITPGPDTAGARDRAHRTVSETGLTHHPEGRRTEPLLRRISGLRTSLEVVSFVGVLWLAAIVLWAAILPNFGSLAAPIHLPWPILAVLFFAAERFIVDLEVREQTHSFSLSEIALLLALIFASPVDLLIGQAVGAGIALSLRSGQRPIKLLFNLANFALSAAVALVVFRWFVGSGQALSVPGWLGAFAAAFISGLIAAAGVAVVIWLSQRERPNLGSLFGFETVYTLVAPSIGLLAATVLWYSPAASWMLIVLGLMVYLLLRFHGREVARHRSVTRLHESTQRIQRSFKHDDVARALLANARDMFEADEAELLLFSSAGSDGQRLRMSDQTARNPGVTLEWHDEHLDPREGVWARVAAEGRGVLIRDSSTARDARSRLAEAVGLIASRTDETAARVLAYFRGRGIRGAMVAPLRVDDIVVGTLQVANRHGSRSEWSNADLTLFETLANHAGVALQNSRQADELSHQRDELERQSTHDSLTGLPNRVLFHQLLNAAIERGASGAVLLMDLDRFKEVNDTLGHQNGDRLLQQVASRLAETDTGSGGVARLGGDEFSLLLPTAELVDAVGAADALLAAFAKPFVVQGVSVPVETSVGLALFPAHGRDADTILRRADVAMYQAKASHSRYVIYEQQHDPYSEARLALLGELRRAIETSELTVLYQPQADARTGAVASVEALVRWHHPQRGELLPDEFIPLAEHSDLIHPLTRFVLGCAIAQVAAWQRAGVTVRVSVNLSARNLHDATLADDIAGLLSQHGVAPVQLELEITETSLESDPADSDVLLGRLHDMGVAIAIDDFGTGYSAFSYLQRLPVDEIKIDRSFVMRMEHDRHQQQIVRSTIQLGHNLGLRVVAEGVESAVVQRRLARLGCDLVQGYHIGHPMSADLVGGLIRRPLRTQSMAAGRSVEDVA